MTNVEKLIRIAESVWDDLNYREYELTMAARSPEQRERERLEMEESVQRYSAPSQEPLYLNCLTIRAVSLDVSDQARVVAEVDVEDPEEEDLDDSALGETMDDDEQLADRREELQVLEMLRWYSRFATASSFKTARPYAHARDDPADMLATTMAESLL